MSPASTLVLGLVLGLRHATDPDHVVAMGTIVTRDPRLRRAILTGAWWGIGHTITVLVVGSLMLIGGVHVPDRTTNAMDLLVATMLVVLGVVALRTSRLASAPDAPRLGERLLVSPLRPLLIGIVHGLAGSAALTLVALATIQDTRGAMLYLALFGVGTIVGMLVITTLLAVSLRWVGSRSEGLPVWIARVSGSLGVTAGLVVAARVLIQ
ncbi:MAG: high-affinity nickel-transport family protein [Labilithrix sp.]|nr:high-affinity nickel-transport family protein [Labilithrix sp.]MCW5817458.1 high-affinity nickel-transport family protein [Labilithrix sp.]